MTSLELITDCCPIIVILATARLKNNKPYIYIWLLVLYNILRDLIGQGVKELFLIGSHAFDGRQLSDLLHQFTFQIIYIQSGSISLRKHAVSRYRSRQHNITADILIDQHMPSFNSKHV